MFPDVDNNSQIMLTQRSKFIDERTMFGKYTNGHQQADTGGVIATLQESCGPNKQKEYFKRRLIDIINRVSADVKSEEH